MDENKWEYDYSSSNNPAGDTGYPNVGSSGMNTANTASTFSESTQPSGGATPPPAGPQNTAPAAPKKPRKNAGKAVKSIVALVLAAAMGFMGGFVGARFGGNNKVIIQQVERSSSSSADSESAAEGTTVSSGMTTAQVAKTVSPSVVVITTEQVVYSQWSWYGQSQVESGAGSGVIISSDGYILTCDHVVSGASNITVTIGDKDYTATVVGEDSTSDIAVIKIDADGLTPAIVGDSDKLAVGDNVLAVGNPLGELGGTVTSGIVSALDRDITLNGNSMSLLQTNAAINPGNSGGGMFNDKGELVGIVVAKSGGTTSDGTTIEGLGFAIPIDDVKEVVQELSTNGYVTGRPSLGVNLVDITNEQTAMMYRVNQLGVYVLKSTNEANNLQAGDCIVSVDGTAVSSADEVKSIIQDHKVGDTLSIVIIREGKTMTVEAALQENKPDTSSNDENTAGGNNGQDSGGQDSQQTPEDSQGGSLRDWLNQFGF